MWPSWNAEKQRIKAALQNHSTTTRALPGIARATSLQTLAMQFVASLRREKYYELVQGKPITAARANPNSPLFDAERAVAYHVQQNNIDEAAWLVFLMTHFARPSDSGWLRLQDVYGKLGAGIWTWDSVSPDPSVFVTWLTANWRSIRGKFGNHRKYESLNPSSTRGTGKVIESYVRLIGANGHRNFFANAVRKGGNHPHDIFDFLYYSLKIKSFGRLARFDYLSLIGRYSIAPIDAGLAYLGGATGPRRGAHLLFDGSTTGTSSDAELQEMMDALDADLLVTMKVMEDALCNWQKSPDRFIHFKG